MSLASAFLCLGLLACQDDAPVGPLGIPMAEDGQVFAGAATVDLTPTILETFSDLDGDGTFDGQLDDPTGAEGGEPFDDVDGDGWFDAVFIGGYGPMRPAQEIHDPITVRALVLAQDGEYIALAVGDYVGLANPRIFPVAVILAADGFNPDRLVVAATHNHEGPDTMGLWGNPEDFANPVSGMDPAYQERVTAGIEQAVRTAAADMRPVSLHVAAGRMRDRDPYFNGPRFGGKNPTDKMHGMIKDIRDPVLASDRLLVLQGLADDGEAVFTFTNWSGHPETWGDENNAISSDWVGVTREVLEEHFGGVALHMPECLGGMQSAEGGDVPLVDEEGEHVYQSCDEQAVANPKDAECYGLSAGDARIDADGDPVPAWAEHDSWDFVRSHGWHIAEAAIDLLEEGEQIQLDPLRVEWEDLYVSVDNLGYQMLGAVDIFDLNLADLVTDSDLCPEASAGGDSGCMHTRTMRASLGPISLISAPGELLPELAWGFPDDEAWETEAVDPSARGTGTYFPQHDSDCDELEWEQCVDTDAVDDCDCLDVHAWPYTLDSTGQAPPLLDLLDGEYVSVLGMTDNYFGYIIPQPDFNTDVSLLSDEDGDHYEDTVSLSPTFATRLQEAQLRIEERW